MPRSRSLDHDTSNSEIKRTLKVLRKQKAASTSSITSHNMGDMVLRDYTMPSIDRATLSMFRLVIYAIHFKIKPTIIHIIQNIVQFNRLAHEDPNWYITNFLDICDSFK